MTPRDWEGEWAAIVERKAAAMANAGRLQAEIVGCLQGRKPPAMQLLRAADRAAAELADVKALEEAFLRDWRGVLRPA